MDDIKINVAKNIAAYRKSLNLTQLQLAEKLNYSDKAVSKWERAEAVPDIYILKELANLFGITVDELISANAPSPQKKEKQPLPKRNKAIIPLLSVGLVWLVATLCFAILRWVEVSFHPWLMFIYAIPVSAIVGIVFSSLWSKRSVTITLVSVLIWSLALSLTLSVPLRYTWLFFIIAIPLQVLAILWGGLKKK